MELKEAIEHTKNMKGDKYSFEEIMMLVYNGKDWRKQVAKHFYLTREAWLRGDLETVAEFFGLYV